LSFCERVCDLANPLPGAIAGRAVPGVGFPAMAANSSESLMSAGSVDRRPAIWPWLVMPLVTLALFFALCKLRQSQDTRDFNVELQTTASAPANAASP
jgi:hypothetical protein